MNRPLRSLGYIALWLGALLIALARPDWTGGLILLALFGLVAIPSLPGTGREKVIAGLVVLALEAVVCGAILAFAWLLTGLVPVPPIWLGLGIGALAVLILWLVPLQATPEPTQITPLPGNSGTVRPASRPLPAAKPEVADEAPAAPPPVERPAPVAPPAAPVAPVAAPAAPVVVPPAPPVPVPSAPVAAAPVTPAPVAPTPAAPSETKDLTSLLGRLIDDSDAPAQSLSFEDMEAPLTERPAALSDEDRWSAFYAKIVAIGDLLERPETTDATLEAALDEFDPTPDTVQEVLLAFGEVEGQGPLRLQTLLLARPWVSLDWVSSETLMVLLSESLASGGAARERALGLAERWLAQEPQFGEQERALLPSFVARLIALPSSGAERARIDAIAAGFEAL